MDLGWTLFILFYAVASPFAIWYLSRDFRKTRARRRLEQEDLDSWDSEEYEARCTVVLASLYNLLWKNLDAYCHIARLRQELHAIEVPDGEVSTEVEHLADEWHETGLNACLSRLRLHNFITHPMLSDKETIDTSRIRLTAEGVVAITRYADSPNPTATIFKANREGDTYVDQKIIHLGDGATVSAPLIIADTIERTSINVSHSRADGNAKELLQQLLREVTDVGKAPGVDVLEAQAMARDVETAAGEITSSAPRPQKVRRTLKEISETAHAIGAAAKPITETVRALLQLFPEG